MYCASRRRRVSVSDAVGIGNIGELRTKALELVVDDVDRVVLQLLAVRLDEVGGDSSDGHVAEHSEVYAADRVGAA